jgi:hypothetical protein
MSEVCIVCSKNHIVKVGSAGNIRAKILVSNNPIVNFSAKTKIVANNGLKVFAKTTLASSSNIKTITNLLHGPIELSEAGECNIKARLQLRGSIRSRSAAVSKFSQTFVDKFAGHIEQINSLEDFRASEKLYPIKDIVTSYNNNIFVDKTLNTSKLYNSIDEGIYIGNYSKHGKTGRMIADDKNSYIQPSSIFTSGDFRYKFEVTAPIEDGKNSFLFIRAAAPVSTYASNIPPQYKIHNIKLEDPSGNLITKYKDIILRGDADYNSNYVNFSTYISEPEINNLLLRTWEQGYPVMGRPSGYTLNLDFNIQCLDDPFNEAFGAGYEDTCKLNVANLPQNFALTPSNSLRISAIEIANSGDYCVMCSGRGVKRDAYLGFNVEVDSIGRRLKRSILPSQVIPNYVNVDIYPSANTVWVSSPDSYSNVAYNTSVSGSEILTSRLQNDAPYDYITLVSTSPISDSGRLTLKFSHQPPTTVRDYTNGSFSFGDKSFSAATMQYIPQVDHFFTIDNISLRVLAKKAAGTRDYALDIVGYSDDRILNITPKIGAFLQNNDSGYGDIPQISGFRNIDDLGISTETLSDKNQYYQQNLTTISAGDHYKLSTTPLVNTTTFKEYIIPLKIYKDDIELGMPIDYSMSSYFENLYFDIFPLPSGASISKIELLIEYKPSNGLMLHTFAHANKDLAMRKVDIIPSSRRANDKIINSGPTLSPLSKIENIPHAFTTPSSIKSNYSRRWFGVDNKITNGPFNVAEFDFSYENAEVEHPFLSGFYNFNYNSGNFIISTPLGSNLGGLRGTFNSSYQNSKISNIGLRFKNQNLFANQLPGYSGKYTTIDWTSLSSGNNNFINHPLYGKIADAYDNAIRISGVNGNINFGKVDTSKGFAIYARFSPDITVSGSNYNLFNSGVIFSQWDTGANQGFALGYENGYLCATVNISGTILKAKDTTPYYEYQYPLSTLLTFREFASGSPLETDNITLYTDNEIVNNFNIKRDIITPTGSVDNIKLLSFNSSSSDLIFGYCPSSGVGMNMFLHEIGISLHNTNTSATAESIYGNKTNLTYSKPSQLYYPDINQYLPTATRDNIYKVSSIQDFFASRRVKYWNSEISNDTDTFNLWAYLDKDISKFKLGDFKICSFSPDFNSFTDRVGDDYLVHNLVHSGSGYSQITNLDIPSNIYVSGLSYHTQIENDFLRLNLSDIDNNSRFYTAGVRINKSLPRGYNFAEEAFVVDTILQHDTYNDIIWSDGSVGPKLIVSLYSTSKDPIQLPSKKNWGLINRAIHYLEPSGCWQKISSKFTYNDLIDISEPWANFDVDQNKTELDHKYYSEDINNMFLQYDLVYPSGRPFSSKIKLHAANIRLEDALVASLENNNSVNLYASGEKKALNSINLSTFSYDVKSSGMSLYSSGNKTIEYGEMNLLCSGAYYLDSSGLQLFTLNKNTFTSASDILFGGIGETEYYLGPNLYVSGKTNKFDEQTLPLIVTNNLRDQSASGNISLFTQSNITSDTINNRFNIYVKASPELVSVFARGSLPLYINKPDLTDFYKENYSGKINLFINGLETKSISNDALNLFTINYPAFNSSISQQSTISWNSNNSGKNISVNDNRYAFLAANDEIRGVELICYGACPTGLCKEETLTIHEVDWTTPSICNDGGIFRAKNTYTNLSASGFKTDVGYSGNFYGIRKYDGLIPNAPYSVTIVGKTGSNKSITLPTEFTEIEYGSDTYTNYSGIKLVHDNDRQVGDKFGKSVAVKNNVMAIGAPMHSLSYQENNTSYTLNEAGAVYIYRREDRPTGYEWPENKSKSPWLFETKLTLPSGLLKDYSISSIRNNIENIVLPLDITETTWNVGQDGRQFGHSLDIASTAKHKSFEENIREILVVGGPSAKWNRSFDGLETSGVQIGLMIFTDEFTPTIYRDRSSSTYSYVDILESIKNKDIIFKYFSDPPIRFDVKLIICEANANSTNITSVDFPEPKPDFIVKKRIQRNKGPVNPDRTNAIFSGIKEAFHSAFPYDENKLHNNIPPILGLYVDNSRSLGKLALNPALTQFTNYFKEYSFASGLRDFYGVRDSGAIVEFIPDFGTAENWVVMSQLILDNVLDTGRLLANNQVRFLTSGVGQDYFNENLGEFNYPPESGGRVYVFEKESGSWNLIQEIKSPNITYSTPDRFGHAVALSDDTEVLAIGSPYINEAFKVYEYKPEEKSRLYNGLYSWLSYKNSATGGLLVKYSKLVGDYITWANKYGVQYANKILYSKLDSTDKFHARQYLNIQEYQSIYTYRYSDIGLVCSNWEFIPQHFAPTSRLGYSVAINEDGTYVACGAPTDSFNQWEDGNVYYKNLGYANPNDTENLNTSLIKPNWRSSVNAGAVRVFESRKYYPHNTVVEFGKFGNLQESMNFPEDSGHFNYLASIFQDKNFRKTEFTDVNIPQEAGLAFIITPEVDALSDEVADNILDWLALGDRNLVLVGNDPVWEKGGIYEKSNDIINKILSRLQSRMRLLPARNAYEAMVSGCSFAIPSFTPDGATQSYVQPVSTSIYGVGDIRMYLGENSTYNATMPCVSKNNLLGTELIDRNESSQEVLNNKCELPLRHFGDLRAQWVSRCRDCKDSWIYYPVNWPFMFRTFQPGCCGSPSEEVYRFFAPNQEPVPLMVAADYHTEIITIPASPAISGYRPVYKDVTVDINTDYYLFSEDKLQLSPAFIWDSGVEGYSSISYNIDNSNPEGLFYKPDSFDDRQSLLLANAISQEKIVPGSQLVSDNGYFAVEESLTNKSKIIFIAGLETESSNNLYSGAGDKNINFYANLVAKSINQGSQILQLGSWTGRDSFVSAYSGSILKSLFENNLCEVLENSNKLYDNYDICWIANPLGLPSESELLELKQWIALPDKKLIVTYDNNLSQVLIIKQLSDLLNSKIKPLYLNVDDKYAQSQAGPDGIYDPAPLIFNANHPVSTGFNVFYSINNYSLENPFKFTPIKLVSGLTPICYINKQIYDTKYNTVGYWKMSTGVTKATFPAIPGSGYKIFISTISETPSENESLNIAIQNVSKSPQGSFTFNQCVKPDCSTLSIPNVGFLYTTNIAPTPNIIQTQTVNLKAKEDVSEINFYIYNESDRINTITNSYLPKTTRLHSISGVLMPIEKITNKNSYVVSEISGWELVETSPAKEAVTFTSTRLSAILNDNTRYCESNCEETLGHKLIEDGPVIVAQEIEHFSEFLAGVARSRITLLADSSLVQGQCMGDEFFRTSNESVNFLRSLYPYTNFPDTNSGRQYTTMHKIISPERGSPNKYRAILNNSGINSRFGDGIATSMSLTSFEDKESRYDPKYVQRPKSNPWSQTASEEEIKLIKKQYIKDFSDAQFVEGGTAMFSGIINGTLYRDAGIGGGIPQIMKDTGYDYLDFDFLPSGYPGDLFGYSIALYKDKLIIGSPFSAFSKDTVNDWNYVINGGSTSGIALSHNGGAGSVYVFEHTGRGSGLNGTTTPWEFTQKLRPDSLNIGTNSGDSIITDQFGYDVDIDGDIIIVGAPGHDYGNHYINGSGAFIRKCFNEDFDIPSRKSFDLGNSGNRQLYPFTQILNNGSIFTFENKIVNWETKTKDWIYAEKVVPQWNYTNINSNFGRSVSIDKANRSDSDYVIVGGADNYDFSSSGTDYKNSSGGSYTTDIVLRNSIAIQSPEAYIDATFFGETDTSGNPKIKLLFSNGNIGNKEYTTTGIIYSNNEGEIFIEASGKDPVAKGFIEHRPYIRSVDGQYVYGFPISGNFPLFIEGKRDVDQNMNIFTNVDDTANVYNTLGLYNSAVYDIISGAYPSGLKLYVHTPNPSGLSANFCLSVSGIGSYTDTLNMRIRGK